MIPDHVTGVKTFAVRAIAVNTSAVNIFVTARLRGTTHCHPNFGYYFGKRLIPCVVMSDRTGPRYALKGRVVYSR
jgi:hypothetical protein